MAREKKPKTTRALSQMGFFKKSFYYIMLSIIGISMLLPFLWMVATSLKSEGEVFAFPPTWIPSETTYYTTLNKDLVKSILSYRTVKGFSEGIEGIENLLPGTREESDEKLKVKIIKEEVRIKILSGEHAGKEIEIGKSFLARYVPSWFLPWVKKPCVYLAEINVGLGLMARGERLDEDLNVKIPCEIIQEKVFIKIIDAEGPLLDEKCWVAASGIIRKWKPAFLWDNYSKAWKAFPFGRAYMNSIIIAVCVMFGQAFTSSMAAYAFARLHFPGRDKIFIMYLGTMMIPYAVLMIPVFVILRLAPDILNHVTSVAATLFSRLFGGSAESVVTIEFWKSEFEVFGHYIGRPIGLDSYFALIVPGMFNAYGTFMLRQFFMSIPVDLEDAAKIDGCSLFGIYTRIILPLSKPALATLVTFTFMGVWRDFMWPLIVTSNDQMKTLPVLLNSFQGVYSTNWTLLMAASLIVLAPVIIVFVFNQRFFVEGIQLGAIKG